MRFHRGAAGGRNVRRTIELPAGGAARAPFAVFDRRGSALPDHFPPSPFRCDVTHVNGSIRLRPFGELDMSTAPVLERPHRGLRDPGATLDRRPARARLHGLDRADAADALVARRPSATGSRSRWSRATTASSGCSRLTRLVTHFKFVYWVGHARYGRTMRSELIDAAGGTAARFAARGAGQRDGRAQEALLRARPGSGQGLSSRTTTSSWCSKAG